MKSLVQLKKSLEKLLLNCELTILITCIYCASLDLGRLKEEAKVTLYCCAGQYLYGVDGATVSRGALSANNSTAQRSAGKARFEPAPPNILIGRPDTAGEDGGAGRVQDQFICRVTDKTQCKRI